MAREIDSTTWRRTICGVFAAAILGAMATSIAVATEPLSLEQIKSRLEEQREIIESLYVRVRRETTVSVDREALLRRSGQLSLPRYLGWDEILFAFKGDKRYCRVLGLECRPVGAAELSTDEGGAVQPHIDETRAYDGKTLRAREKDFSSGGFQYRSVSLTEARDSLPPPQYLMNVGLGVDDLSAGAFDHRVRKPVAFRGTQCELRRNYPFFEKPIRFNERWLS